MKMVTMPDETLEGALQQAEQLGIRKALAALASAPKSPDADKLFSWGYETGLLAAFGLVEGLLERVE